jgi:hypothetical protein
MKTPATFLERVRTSVGSAHALRRLTSMCSVVRRSVALGLVADEQSGSVRVFDIVDGF